MAAYKILWAKILVLTKAGSPRQGVADAREGRDRKFSRQNQVGRRQARRLEQDLDSSMFSAGRCFCLAMLPLAGALFFSAALPAAADVIALDANGAPTVYSGPGVYRDGVFMPLSPAPRSAVAARRAAQGAVQPTLALAAGRYAVDPDLLARVAWSESRNNQAAISPKGAVGVMQLMDDTARGLGVDRYDLAQNILGGAAYLRQMLDRYRGDTRLALAAYNAGPGAVDHYGGVPPYRETAAFVAAVLGEARP
jgi:soluble lytic murein transglycosylase-like protein